MKKTTFRIRQRIIQAFLFCVLAVLIFAGLSFETHREIGRHLRLVELADDLLNNILEIRRFEKNLFLYHQADSLTEVRAYIDRVHEICCSHEQEILGLREVAQQSNFHGILKKYQETLGQIEAIFHDTTRAGGALNFSPLDETLRNLGQELLSLASRWAKQERLAIDRLYLRAMYLFVISVVVFVILGILVAWYISRLLVRPLFQMQQYMEKIAHGDFNPIPESECRSQEFFTLFKAFNRMIRELEHHQEQVIQSGKIAAIGTLTSGVAHELNNPINNIVLTAEAMKEDFPKLSQEESMEMIHDILVQSQRASEIVKNLLDFSRSERPEMEPTDIVNVIRDSVKLVHNQLLLSGVELEQNIPPGLPPVYGDARTLQQVFLNLFINAIQAMKGGGTLTIRVHPLQDGGQLKIEVVDSGIGISPEDLPHIFEPFFTTKKVGRGTGLGLSVSYGIIQKHGGHMEVHSQRNRGTTLTIYLPVMKEEKAAEWIT